MLIGLNQMNIDVNKLFRLPEGSYQIYSWKTLKNTNINYDEGDVGLIDFIGTDEEPSETFEDEPYLVQSVWGSICPLYEAKFCPDLGKIKLSYLGSLDFTDDFLIYFELWIKLKKEEINPTKRQKTSLWDLELNGTGSSYPSTLLSEGIKQSEQTQTTQKPPEEYNLLSSRNLKYYYDLWNSKENDNKGVFKLGKVEFYPACECPY